MGSTKITKNLMPVKNTSYTVSPLPKNRVDSADSQVSFLKYILFLKQRRGLSSLCLVILKCILFLR